MRLAEHTGTGGGTAVAVEWTPINASPGERAALDSGRAGMEQGWRGTSEPHFEYLAEVRQTDTEHMMTTDTTPRADAPGAPAPRSMTRHLPTVARGLLGLLFVVTGLNGFLNFLPRPATMPEGAGAFAGALMQTGYMFPLIMGTQLLAGALLLVGRFVPLALVLLAPVLVNIIAFHVFLDPAGIGPGALALLLELGLVWAYRDSYRTLFAARATPPARRRGP